MANNPPPVQGPDLWRAQLAEAEDALQDLIVNGALTRSRFNNRETENRPASEAGLRARIAELKAKLGMGGRLRGRRMAV